MPDALYLSTYLHSTSNPHALVKTSLSPRYL